jgi:hypothetical protein
MSELYQINGKTYTLAEIEKIAFEAIEANASEGVQAIKNESFSEGAAYILDYLEAVYGEGIHLTDVWAEYMGACECHSEEDEEL